MLTVALMIVFKVAIIIAYYILCKPVWLGITKLNKNTHEHSEIKDLTYFQRVLFYLWLCVGCNIIVFMVLYHT